MPEITSQLRQAFRRLWNTPAFTLLCVLTLAVGMGATVAVFSVVNGILLRPLPYPETERLVGLWHTAPGLDLPQIPVSDAIYLRYREHSKALQGVALYSDVMVNLTGGEVPERLLAAAVTASLFPVLKVAPRIGRGFIAEEEGPGFPPVVVLSDRLWRRRFGADQSILGRTVRINGAESEIVGVMPASFEFPSPRTDLWLLHKIDPANAELGRLESFGVGRLAPDVTIQEAQTDLNRLLANLEQSFPSSQAAPVLARAGFAARVHPLHEDVVGDVKDMLWILLGAVSFILLIACANVANLLIVRGEGRRREIAIQTSLGATRGRMIGGVLAESLLLGLAAGAAGLAFAALGLRLLLYLQPAGLPRLEAVGIDGRVLAFTVAASLVTSLLFGLMPAVRATAQQDLATELRGGGRAVTMGQGRRRSRQVLVGVQVALALMLLTGSGLMLRSFLHLIRLDPGYETRGILTLQLALPEREYPDDAATARFFRQVSDRLAGLPGVVSVGMTSALPLSGSAPARGHQIEGVVLEQNAPPPVIGYEHVTAGYLQALGVPLVGGRHLEWTDQEHRTGAVLVSEAVARHYWPNGSALGKRLRPDVDSTAEDPWYTVVGVVHGVRNRRLTEEPGEIVYYPMLGKGGGDWTVRQVYAVVHTRVEPESLVSSVRKEIWSMAPDLPLANVQTMEQLVRRAQARMNFSFLMLLIASAVALTLGAVGIYAFVSYLVTQRTREIGVRMAIGAGARAIRWMILKESLVIAVIGLFVGLVGSAALTRWLEALLFEVSPLDPVTFALVPILLVAVVLLSSFLPANRAAHTDPLVALRRYE